MKTKDLIMKYEDYYKVHHKVPYTFNLSNKKQYLYYFGSKHTFDPVHPQFKKVDSFWKSFLQKTKGKNCIVLVEGGKRPILKTLKEATLTNGEMGYVTYLASGSKIDTFSPEPPMKYVYKFLEKHFSRQEIQYYFFARVCFQWNNMKRKPAFESYLKPFLLRDKKESGWKNFNFSIANMKKIHTKIFKIPFNENDKMFFYDVINPTTLKTNINKVSRLEDEGMRDVYIVNQIEKLWKKGKNIFVIYGYGHAIVQKKALQYMIKQ